MPEGGVHLWARLLGDPDADDADVVFQARRAGVIVMPGRPFFPAESLTGKLCVASGCWRRASGVGLLFW